MARNLTTDDVVDTSARPAASSLGATDSILTYDDINKIIKKSAPSVLKTAMDLNGVTSTVITGLVNDIDGLNNPTEQKGDNGYVTLPSGIILQWGFIADIGDNAFIVQNYNIAFPNAVFAVYSSASSSATEHLTTVAEKDTNSTFITYGNHNPSIHWFAIGY